MGAPTLDLSAQQAEAIDKIVAWYDNPHAEQVFRLFGYAGTGKTTIARAAVDALSLERPALYAAYTGKAAYVLQSKGCDDASTVHSLIYQPVAKIRERLAKLEKEHAVEDDPDRRAALARQIKREKDRLAQPDFVLKDESDLEDAPLLVLDEVSMVGERMAHDLLGFGTRLLVLGDPAQLPPVDGGGYFINADPDHLLTEIHRSAADSPVTKIATAIRQSKPGDRNRGLDGRIADSGRLLARMSTAELASFDQVLVGKNATRWDIIRRIRGMYGWHDPVPRPGDRIIVIANNKGLGVFNGQQFTVAIAAADRQYPDDVVNALLVDDEDNYLQLPMWRHGFTGHDGEKQAKANGRSRIAAATFAQAITTHKSQGSQWDTVAVIDESNVFAGMEFRRYADRDPNLAGEKAHVAASRWLYTAVTRAVQRVVLTPGVA